MNKILTALSILLLTLSFASCHNKGSAKQDETQIRLLLTQQVAAWNDGNVEGYMKGYWEDEKLMFIGKNGPVYGYDSTLARYKKAYPDKAAMGVLTSTVISMDHLGEDDYFVVGKWQLKRSAGNIGGSWTLLFKRLDGKWVIVADHSS